jgi:HSP20 family protein
MTLVKFNQKPFGGSFNNFVDDLIAGFPVLTKNEASQQWEGFVPVNIKETEKNYSIEMVAPGFEKTDFKISLDQQILTVSAEKQNEVKSDSDNYRHEKQIRKEYSYRSFKRSFTLDEKTDGAAVDAKYVNGVLTLNLPKKEEVKPSVQQINIQ